MCVRRLGKLPKSIIPYITDSEILFTDVRQTQSGEARQGSGVFHSISSALVAALSPYQDTRGKFVNAVVAPLPFSFVPFDETVESTCLSMIDSARVDGLRVAMINHVRELPVRKSWSWTYPKRPVDVHPHYHTEHLASILRLGQRRFPVFLVDLKAHFVMNWQR